MRDHEINIQKPDRLCKGDNINLVEINKNSEDSKKSIKISLTEAIGENFPSTTKILTDK